MESDVKDLNLALEGRKRIEWSANDMPVLRLVKERFEKEKPLAGKKLGACLHVTKETANLMLTLKAGGAELALCASNPLSTQDDVAASLVKDFGISVLALRGEDNETYYQHINAVLKTQPHLTMDDGADLIFTLHNSYPGQVAQILASMEETTTGVIRLRAMEGQGKLKLPVIAVNDADMKHLFDNRYGTGQSTIDGLLRATGVLLAGKKMVVSGYGWCGRGIATRARGMGAHVIVTEVNPVRALEAALDGFWVMSMREAAKVGEIFVTSTGDTSVIGKEHFALMKDGALLANAGHFNVEIDIKALEALAASVNKRVKENVDEYVMRDGRRIYLLAEGRLINLAAAEGHPSSVMDMSFAIQALCAEHVVKLGEKLDSRVHPVPVEIDQTVADLKLQAMGIKIDTLTPAQEQYLSSWEIGT